WPTWWDWATLLGTVGFFTFGLCLFARYLPIVPMSETSRLLHRLWPPGGHRRLDACTPYPVEGLAEALGLRRPRPVALAALLGGLAGAAGGYALQAYVMAVDYPLNVGGRPLHSWPAFVPVTFELMVLAASLSATVALFVGNRLPQPHHPLFGAPG